MNKQKRPNSRANSWGYIANSLYKKTVEFAEFAEFAELVELVELVVYIEFVVYIERHYWYTPLYLIVFSVF